MPITCFFCFHPFQAENLEYRCKNQACPGFPGRPNARVDALYSEKHFTPPTMMGNFFKPAAKGGLFRRGPATTCNLCGQESHFPLCPLCHYELPYDITQMEQHIIAIVGGRNTGKSHYIATLIYSLKREVGRNIGISVDMIGDDTRQYWNDIFYNRLYRERRLLDQTDSATAAAAPVKTPLIFRLTFGSQGNARNTRAVNLVCFDTAGEDMTSITTMSQQNLYITEAEGLVFLLDPLQIPEVRHDPRLAQARLPEELPQADPERVIERLLELFGMQRKLGRNPVPTHVAFTLSKIDVLAPILERDSPLHRSGQHLGGLDEADIESVNTDLSGQLEQWIGSGFSQTVKNRFASSHYFGVSALGAQPNPDRTLNTINTLRVEDPFLWILYKLNMIPARKR